MIAMQARSKDDATPPVKLLSSRAFDEVLSDNIEIRKSKPQIFAEFP